MSKGDSSTLLFKEIQRRAGQVVAATGPLPELDGPSIPVSVNVDRENGSNIREDFLWRLKGVFRLVEQHSCTISIVIPRQVYKGLDYSQTCQQA